MPKYKGNLHYLFYKSYFKGFEYEVEEENVRLIAKADNKAIVEKQNQRLLNAEFSMVKNECSNVQFKLKVVYPGLVTGVGIEHETKIESEFKLGMHFDYTTGMPVIYGSSVKGILRSAFQHKTYIEKLLNIQSNVDELQSIIFDGISMDKKRISIYERDIFYDAVIVQCNGAGNFLDKDVLTPHKNPLKNPIPIPFLKIAPGTIIEFQFDLKDSRLSNGKQITAEEKRNLFKSILLDIGVGAKTNVGYGQFVEGEVKEKS